MEMKCNLLVALSLGCVTGQELSATGRTLLWGDEFDGEELDSSIWNRLILPKGAFNNELQSYTESTANAYVGGGHLTIRAIPNGQGGYTSARLTTKGKRDFKYGYIEVRAKVPKFVGAWPAIWFMPSEDVYGGWPHSGEIDLMEHVTCDLNKVYSTLHTGEYNWMKRSEKKGELNLAAKGLDINDFHTFKVLWTPSNFTFGLDGFTYHTFQNEFTGDSEKWPFDQKFHPILNIAVGGDWGGFCLQGQKPTFPDDGVSNTMVVDYVRWYTHNVDGATDPPTPPPMGVDCAGPFPSNYPECENRIRWVLQNWESDPKFAAGGVDGSRCSIQNFLHTMENLPTGYCPEVDCKGPFPDHSSCENRIKWMLENWQRADLKDAYVAKGVEGSRCSIQYYLFKHEGDPVGESPYCPRPRYGAFSTDAPASTLSPSASSTTLSPSASSTTLSPSASSTSSPSASSTGTIVGVLAGCIAVGSVLSFVALRRYRSRGTLGVEENVAISEAQEQA